MSDLQLRNADFSANGLKCEKTFQMKVLVENMTSLLQFHAKNDITSANLVFYYFSYATKAVSFQLVGRLSVSN